MSRMGEISMAIDEILNGLVEEGRQDRVRLVAAIGPSDLMIQGAHFILQPDRYDEDALRAMFVQGAQMIVDGWQDEPSPDVPDACPRCGAWPNHEGGETCSTSI